MITADQLVAHAIGDYILQSDWMANEKTKRSIAALVHAMTYTLPFLLLTQSPAALAVIAGSHFVVDRWRLARYVVWLKNFLAPRHIPVTVADLKPVMNYAIEAAAAASTGKPEPDHYTYATAYTHNHPWSECSATGYHKDRPQWLAVWLLIIADNTMHVLCNAVAIRWLP